MSGVVKGIKKVFKKVAKVVKKIIKPVAIAVAIYFTAGVALSYMGTAASTFAAGLPGFSGAAGAGTGIFSTAAAKIGLGSGLATGGLAAGTPLAAIEATYGASAAMSAMAANTLPAGQTLAAGTTGAAAGASGIALSGPAVAGGTGAGASIATGVAAGAGGMTFGQKLLLASQGANLAAAAFGPTPEELAEATAAAEGKWQGAFYGMTADGKGAAAPKLESAPNATTGAPALRPTMPIDIPPAGAGIMPTSPEQQQLVDGRQTRTELFPTARGGPEEEDTASNSGLYGVGQMKQQINVPRGINSPAPGVRYI